MKNLIEAITKEQKQYLENFIKELNEESDFKIGKYSYYLGLLPAGKDISKWTVKEQKAYLVSREEKKRYKNIEKEVESIKAVFASGDLVSAKIQVEWKRSQTWGANPSAECWATFKDKQGANSVYVKSGPVSGCGYDKLSTAVAEALNQVYPVLKPMYKLKDKNVNTKNHDLLGYGSGYGILPALEGGVGVSCYPKIFEKIGCKFESVASGKSFDVFQITKL